MSAAWQRATLGWCRSFWLLCEQSYGSKTEHNSLQPRPQELVQEMKVIWSKSCNGPSWLVKGEGRRSP